MAIYVKADEVIDARADVIEGIAPGVQRRPASYLDAYPRWVKMELQCTPSQRKTVIKALEDELEKPYDSVGIWDFATCSLKDRNWRDRSAWFCDELDIYVLELAKLVSPLMLPLYRLTPGTSALIIQASGAKIINFKGWSPQPS